MNERMTENMKQFLELVTADAALKAEMDELNDLHDGEETDEQSIVAMKEKIIQMAGQRGIALTAADFGAHTEMTEDELAAVAGGGPAGDICICPFYGHGTGLGAGGGSGECKCFVGGLGGGAHRSYTCVCCVGGYGG